MYERILVPTDGSPGADRAAEEAIELASTTGAAIHAVFVVEPLYTAEFSTSQIMDQLEREGRRAIERIATMADDAELDCETAVLHGTPHTSILEYGDEHDIDLVVMGTHGRTGLDRYLLGSVTEKVVRAADVPVLTVRIEE